jgi:AraC family transcriptional regulator of adaptative response / DNA-3-methyladenine glycosylase II
VVLEQRVTTFEARRAQSQIIARWSEPAPGPTDLMLPPDPEVLANVAYYDLHVVGVERKRADCVRRAAAVAHRLEEGVSLGRPTLGARLRSLRGIGPWTQTYVNMRALNDRDAWLPTDIGVRHGLARHGPSDPERWRPFRAYAVISLWART